MTPSPCAGKALDDTPRANVLGVFFGGGLLIDTGFLIIILPDTKPSCIYALKKVGQGTVPCPIQNEITNEEGLQSFMKFMNFFHDSCIKELKYISGAYVDENLSMYPVNDQRALKVIFQRQYDEYPMIELEFKGLKYLKLFPVDDQYTCEILDSTLILKNNCVYWADCGDLSKEDIENYSGTIICASKLRWRSLYGFMGKEMFFNSHI